MSWNVPRDRESEWMYGHETIPVEVETGVTKYVDRFLRLSFGVVMLFCVFHHLSLRIRSR